MCPLRLTCVVSITTLAEDYTWYTGSLHSDLLTDRSLAGKSSKIFARCARRQFFFQIFENPDLTQVCALGGGAPWALLGGASCNGQVGSTNMLVALSFFFKSRSDAVKVRLESR